MSCNKILTFVVVLAACVLCASALTCYSCEEKRNHATGVVTGSCAASTWTQVNCTGGTTHCIVSSLNSMWSAFY